jgi:hypothetical protein
MGVEQSHTPDCTHAWHAHPGLRGYLLLWTLLLLLLSDTGQCPSHPGLPVCIGTCPVYLSNQQLQPA